MRAYELASPASAEEAAGNTTRKRTARSSTTPGCRLPTRWTERSGSIAPGTPEIRRCAADQRRLPRRPAHTLGGIDAARGTICCAHVAQEPRFCACCDWYARARHWREHGDFQRDQRRDSARPAVSRSGTTGRRRRAIATIRRELRVFVSRFPGRAARERFISEHRSLSQLRRECYFARRTGIHQLPTDFGGISLCSRGEAVSRP